MNRRDFFKYSIAVGSVFALSPMLTSCAGVHRKSFYENHGGFTMPDLPEKTTRILSYAALSPSGHNTQPWIVKIKSPSEIIIQSDKTRWLPEVDPTNRETFLSLSAFAETLCLASHAVGFDAEISIIAEDLKDSDIFQVKLNEMPTKNERYLGFIKNRVTTRTDFDKKEIKTEQINEVLNIEPEHIEYFPLESNGGKWIAENLPEAVKQQSFNNDKQEELSHWLRFSKSEAKERGDGITAEALGLNWFARFVWYNFYSQKSAMEDSFRNRGIDTAREQVENCSGFVVLTSKDNSLDSIFDSGRLYQKIGLKLTELGIAHHTMSQLLEEEPWSSEIKSNLKIDQPVQFVIRIGYGEDSKPSIRRPVRSFVVS
ncbi:MAG: hypothetical protein GF417_02170 [Candidatus Latescibacteria bacterium]|nr:hypothetical protein [bacterium]MBD3423235.1 hypothetical protein [Candidatus Latescibacterota bacterium]